MVMYLINDVHEVTKPTKEETQKKEKLGIIPDLRLQPHVQG